MKILIFGNSPMAGTGYGQQVATFATRFRDAGYDVAVAANWGIQGAEIEWQGIRVFPAGHESYSNDVVATHAARFFGSEPGIVLTLMDCWVLRPDAFADIPGLVASWTPVDHVPCPPEVVRWFRDTGAVPVAMSRFGEQLLGLAGESPLYAPHGIDTATFSPGSQDAARGLLGLPDGAFVVSMVAANKGRAPCRKSFPEAFEAFARLRAVHPDAFLFVHSDPTAPDGIDLRALAALNGIPREAWAFTNPGLLRGAAIPAERLATIYRASDVLLAPSKGEGFGIPVVEAMACGVPAIVSDFSAQPELVGAPVGGHLTPSSPLMERAPGGWVVNGQYDLDPFQLAKWWAPSTQGIYEALCDAYDDRPDPVAVRAQALPYDADTVMRGFWTPILCDLAHRCWFADAPATCEAVA